MAEKVTIMVLKVDLQCSCCYKKIKKVLCNFPQIRDQLYDEKGNTVTVTVVCCSPEKCRDKLCSKGGKVIKSIEIKEPNVVVVEKPKGPEKPKVVLVEPEKPKPDGGKPPQDKPKQAPKAKGPEPAAKPPAPEPAAKPPAPEPAAKPPAPGPVKLPAANPVSGIPPALPAMACYAPSYDGFGGGAPWYNGYGIAPPPPPPPQPRYDGYYGYEYGYPYGRGWNFNRCDAYFSEENPSSCSIM